jgi:hypothetical protein
VQSAARPTTSSLLPVVMLPLAFLILGLVLRFLAFRTALPEVDPARYLDEVCRWDCSWYVRMAQEGYDPYPVPGRVNAGNWAFFPLYPMLVGLVAKLVPLPTIILASIMSMLLSYVAVLVAWPLFERNLRAYALYAAYLLAGPFSFYFTSFFSETLFVLLTTWVFVALRRSAYMEAAVATSLLSATRIVGVFATLALMLQAALDYRRETGSWRGLIPAVLQRPRLLLAIFIAPTGLFAYMAYLYWLVGDGLAFSHVQRAWAREIGNPLGYFWQALTSFPDAGFWPTPAQWLALAILTGFVMVGLLAWRRQWPAFLFAFIAFALPLFAGTASMLRFVAGMAPVTILAMQLLASRVWLSWLGFAVLLLGCYFVTIAWMTGNVALV